MWGEQNVDGTAKTYMDDAALSNAISSYLMSRKGDYIQAPNEGGPLDAFLFKNLDDGYIEKLKFTIQSTLHINFSALIDLKGVLITPDYTNRLAEIKIIYVSKLSSENNSATIYINDTSKVSNVTYIEIPYTEDNLLAFVQIKYVDMKKKKLLFSEKELAWVWGESFKFINFTTTDSKFSEIIALCNT
jgi:hypothetical protein